MVSVTRAVTARWNGIFMELLGRVLGADRERPWSRPSQWHRDALIVDEYQRMLRTAPTGKLERVHVEAFERLTPEQLGVLFHRFTNSASEDEERLADSPPTSLARPLKPRERGRAGAIACALGFAATGIPVGIWATSIVETAAAFALSSALWGTMGLIGGASASADSLLEVSRAR
jgi:hypothetical protein